MLKSNLLNSKLGYTFYYSPELDIDNKGENDSILIHKKFKLRRNEKCKSSEKERLREINICELNSSLQSKKTIRIKKNTSKNSSLKPEEKAKIFDFSLNVKRANSDYKKGRTFIFNSQENRAETPYFKSNICPQMNERQDLCRQVKNENFLKNTRQSPIIKLEVSDHSQKNTNFPAIFKANSTKSKIHFKEQLIISPKNLVASPVNLENSEFSQRKAERSTSRPSKYYKDRPIIPKTFLKQIFTKKYSS